MTVTYILLFTCIISIVNFIGTNKMEGYVVGGDLSNIEDFPHSVFILITCNNRSTSCGASIVNQEFLLTAAHCLFKCNDTFKIVAHTGSAIKYKGNKTNVISFKLHEKYNDSSNLHDIALMRLEVELTFGPKVQRVMLIKKPEEIQYQTAVIAGWGWIDSVGTKGTLLKHVRQEILDPKTCSSRIGPIPNGTICGRELTGQSYPEKGDSGSALLVNDSIQIGLVSFKRRGFSNDTIVYAYVPYYYEWIMNTAMELSCLDDENTLQ